MLHNSPATAIGPSSELPILGVVRRASITRATSGQVNVDVLSHVRVPEQKQPERAAKWW